jgi:uncharacterized protein
MNRLKHLWIGIMFFLSANQLYGQPIETDYTLKTKTGKIYGTLLLPTKNYSGPVVLLIAGSGPTDRNGNNPAIKNNSLKLLAEAMADSGIAILRYDKRGIGESKDALKSEFDIRFETYVEDAVAWIKKLKKDKRFDAVFPVGHSEGALIGIMASQQVDVAGFISLNGPGISADKLIVKQLKAQSASLANKAEIMLDSLKQGFTVKLIDASLSSLFRPSVQPYIRSWIKYNPADEIKKLNIPVLIIQGETDIQASPEDAELLHASLPEAKMVLIENMNHIFKEAPKDRLKNMMTYSNPKLPIVPSLPQTILTFIREVEK